MSKTCLNYSQRVATWSSSEAASSFFFFFFRLTSRNLKLFLFQVACAHIFTLGFNGVTLPLLSAWSQIFSLGGY